MSAPRISTPPIQFTKAELRVIEAAAKMMGVEWLNGYRSATRMNAVAGILRKINPVLYPDGRTSVAPSPAPGATT